MTFATITRVKRLCNYADAQRAFEFTKPIRGSQGLVPLGQRRDASTYYIEKRETEWGDEFWCFLYRSPVVKFLPDGSIVICTDGWGTGMTMAFIAQVLGIGAYRTRGNCVFVINGTKHVIKNDQKLVLNVDRISGMYYVTEKANHMHYVMNRTGANNVRRRYSEFRKYLKGFLALRSYTVTETSSYSGVSRDTQFVSFGVDELKFLSTQTRKDWRENVYEIVDLQEYNYLTDKQRRFMYFTQAHEMLNKLIANGQGEEAQTGNFYKAALILCAKARGGELVVSGHGISGNDSFVVDPKNVMHLLDTAQFKYYSSEVLSLVPVPDGKVPRTTYDSWIDPVVSDQ